jgi:hypothetical protein
MAVVPWWDGNLDRIQGGSNLSGLVVYFDFSWTEVFGHDKSMFPHGKSLTRLIKRDCPAGKQPALVLTEREEFEAPWIETDNGELVVVVPIHDYLARSDPDPAASYYATRFGPGLTALKQLERLATEGALEVLGARRDVVEAVVRHGLTAEDVELWATLEAGHAEALVDLADSTAGSVDPTRVVTALRRLSSLDTTVLTEIVDLLRRAEFDRDAQLNVLRQLAVPLLGDDAVREAFVRENLDLLEAIIRNDVAAPDVAALARRRKVLEEFERLLHDDEYFNVVKKGVRAAPSASGKTSSKRTHGSSDLRWPRSSCIRGRKNVLSRRLRVLRSPAPGGDPTRCSGQPARSARSCCVR